MGENKKIKQAELYPLSKKEFKKLYNDAWKNGWVYGKFFQELYDEYLINWVYFVDYLDLLMGLNNENRKYKRIPDNFVIVKVKNQKPILIEAKDFYNFDIEIPFNKSKNIEILIGEAPPYWKGNAEENEKAYFYNPRQTYNSPWLNTPVNWKSNKRKFRDKNEKEKNDFYKTAKLELLASKRVVLFDIFPFPIIQDTKVRTEITGGYANHIENYFLKKYTEITEYLKFKEQNITFSHGMVATELGSIQFLCDKTIENFPIYQSIIKNSIEFNAFDDWESWIQKLINITPNKAKISEEKTDMKNHYLKYKINYIPIVKVNSDEKYDFSDKLKFIRNLMGIDSLSINESDIQKIYKKITMLPIFIKGQSVVINGIFINGNIS